MLLPNFHAGGGESGTMENCANALNHLISLATIGHTISVLSVQSLMSLIQCWSSSQSLGIKVSLQDVGAEDLGPERHG